MSENESKRMKNDSSSESLLPENAIAILNKSMKEGFKDGILNLELKSEWCIIVFMICCVDYEE